MRLPNDDASITPITELFTYHIFGLPGELKRWQERISDYSLAVTGLVKRPLRLSLRQLGEEFEAVSGDMILQCMTNVHWGRVRFTGARLLDALEYAGCLEKAYKVAFHGADGFDTDLRLTEIRERPDAFLLAYVMNGMPLTPEHGFPLRMTADGRYGFKWCKWLDKIELVDYDYKGHYEGNRGWSDKGTRGQPVQ